MVDYDKDDETEMVIRILSFGPMIKVVQPEHFINLIQRAFKKTKKLGTIISQLCNFII